MTRRAAVVGGGPAGLMAADVLAAAGVEVHLYDAMPSVGRKFLLAGKGGLNLTHSEPAAVFETRFGKRQAEVAAWLRSFGAAQLRAWAQALGVETFVGSSGRVFPVDMKAAPLLRAWLHRLRHPDHGHPVQLHMRHRWRGWEEDPPADATRLRFDTPDGPRVVAADAVVLALGGASWPRLGSDGAWVEPLRARGVPVAPLLPANCGFDRAGGWSPHFVQRFAGQPFKSVTIHVPAGPAGPAFERKGEFVATATGIEGSLVYAASGLLRDTIAAQGWAELFVDLLPDFTPERVLHEVAHPRGSRSLSSHLKSRLGIGGIKAGLLHEVLGREQPADAQRIAHTLKALPLRLQAARPVAEAISSAGGVRFDGLDAHLMLRGCPGVFCAGEMLDWEAPTGGYLLTAAMASGRIAADGALQYLHGAA
ncbi:MAG: TIGR03862 family flavoprotein [Rhodoferax sp.]|nr:TIGR03862 family flavoprotein [Rhodoferax sp.]